MPQIQKSYIESLDPDAIVFWDKDSGRYLGPESCDPNNNLSTLLQIHKSVGY